MIFERVGGGFLKISYPILEIFSGFAQTTVSKPEAGGVLLGRHILDTDDIIIDFVTTPMVEDRQSRYCFFRSELRHQQIIEQTWIDSHETCTYLGEWHTHPEPIPHPSFLDKGTWRRKLMFDQFSECLFFIIVGTVEISVWEGKFRNTQLTKLKMNN